MRKALIGKKIGMTQLFAEDGSMVPVTVVELGPNVVVQKKTADKDGYESIKLGFGDVKEKDLTKALAGEFKKRNVAEMKKSLREVDLFDSSFEVGSVLTCDIFSENDFVDVEGVSKGKGFQGTMKRHNFKGGRASHGSSFHRAPGSMGCRTYPGEVWKGKKMAGRMGTDTVTVKNLKVVKVLKEKNTILVSGAIPGRRNSLVLVKGK